jgi:hypothetical protein
VRQSSISAIIPTFNRRALLVECIDSVLAAGDRIGQVIVVNDGSTDDTSAFVASAYGERVALIDKPNGGKSSALNLGLAHATSEYVWICDDDDIAAGAGVAALAAALDANPNAGFAFGSFKIFRDLPSGRVYTPPTYWLRPGEPNFHLQFLEEMFTFQYATLVRRSVYDRVGPFREDMVRSQDHEMMIRVSRAFAAIQAPEVIFFQRAHAGQRGSAAVSFSEQHSAAKWLEFGQRMISEVRSTYALEEFTPSFAKAWPAPMARRAALVERACISASRAMWPQAIADLRDAAAASPSEATPQELQLAEAVIRNPLAWSALSRDAAAKRSLRAVWKTNGYGRAIVEACCRPLVWQSRRLLQGGDPLGAGRLGKTLLDIVSVAGSLRRVSASLQR